MLLEKRNFLNTTEFQNSFGFLNGDMAFPWFYSKNTAYGMAEDNHQLWDFSFSHVDNFIGIAHGAKSVGN